jgi:hypothetical protein
MIHDRLRELTRYVSYHLAVEPDRSTGEWLVTDYHPFGFTVLGRFPTHQDALEFWAKVRREPTRKE